MLTKKKAACKRKVRQAALSGVLSPWNELPKRTTVTSRRQVDDSQSWQLRQTGIRHVQADHLRKELQVLPGIRSALECDQQGIRTLRLSGMKKRLKALDPHFLSYLELVRTLMRKISLSRNARCLYMYLTTFENLKTNQSKPGQRLICHELQMSKTTLATLLDELHEQKLIVVHQEPRKNGNLNVYTLIAPQPDAQISSPGNLVLFPSRTSTNSTRSTTRLDGNSASK